MRRLLLIAWILAAIPLAAQTQQQGTLTALDVGTCSTTGAYVRMALSPTDSTAAITLTDNGTAWSATVTFVGSTDNGRSWSPMAGVNWATPTTVAPASTASAKGGWTFDVTGKTNVCAYLTTYASGTVIVGIASVPSRATNLLSPANFALYTPNLSQPVLGDAGRLRTSTYSDPLTIAGSISTKVATSSNPVNTQTTLTIPAPPPGLYNYICMVAYTASQDGTATAQTNAVTTSTNFNSYALKYSLTATATINYTYQDWFDTVVGCAKSDAPGTATTFVSPVAGANIAFTWRSLFYQAP